MLDISFYTAKREPAYHVEVAENFLEWLAKSEFAQIGQDKSTKVLIDGEEIIQPLVKLGKKNRKKMMQFFSNAIVSETKGILNKLEKLRMQNEETYRLKKLIELLDCIKNENYLYLQRI
jgi:hypothetical protein